MDLILRKETPFENRSEISEHLLDVIYAINALPGIFNITTNLTEFNAIEDTHSKFRVFFYVDPSEPQGLFFLTRCKDQRYWKYGGGWDLSLSVGDTYVGGILPICYMLESSLGKKETILKQCESLFDNMNYHIHHKAFMTGFEIDISKFNLMNKTSAKRNLKLSDLGI